MSSLLALDASSFVGWSLWKAPTDTNPYCRTWKAKSRWDDEAYGPYLFEFKTWLGGMLDLHRPEVLAFESPIVVASWGKGRGSDENNIRRLIGVVTVAELMAYERDLVCVEVNNSTAKAYVGVSTRRNGMSDGQYKQLMVDVMTLRGYRVGDSHQADSCAVAMVAYEDLGMPVPDGQMA